MSCKYIDCCKSSHYGCKFINYDCDRLDINPLDSEILDHLIGYPKRSDFILNQIRCNGKQNFVHIKNRRSGRSKRDVLAIVKLLSESYNYDTKVVVIVKNMEEIRYHYKDIVEVCFTLGIQEILGDMRNGAYENIKFVIDKESLEKFAGQRVVYYRTHYAKGEN
jgi:hypothetical protein